MLSLKFFIHKIRNTCTFIFQFPEIIDTFSTLYQMMDSRVNMFGKLSRLQGKLDLMLSQISTQTQEEEEPITQQPLLQYQEGRIGGRERGGGGNRGDGVVGVEQVISHVITDIYTNIGRKTCYTTTSATISRRYM